MLRTGVPLQTTGQNLVGLWRPSFTRVRNKLYVFGGGGNVTNDLNVLDLKELKWECVQNIKGSPPCKRYGHTASLWRDSIIIFGGCNEFSDYCNDLHIFDVQKSTWFRPDIRGANVPARYLHTATVYNDKLYVYGGFAKNSECTYVLDELSILDLTTFTWSKNHTVPPRYNHSATLIDSKLYIYAGKDEQGTTVSDLFFIDLSTPTLHPHQVLGCHYGGSGQLVLLKSQHFCEAVCGKLLVFGRYLVSDAVNACGSVTSANSTSVAGLGTNGNSGQNSVYGLWLLDLSTLEWKRLDCSGCFDTGGWNYFTVMEDVSSAPSSSSRSSHDLSSHAQEDVPDHLLFLGNIDPVRPQGYDHFRDTLFLPAESLGLYSIPPPRISNDFAYLLDNSELSDFVIVPSDRREIHVHQVILISRWPHFRNVYNSGMIESTRHRMEIPEPHDVVLAFLRYLYTDTVDEQEDWEVVADVLVLANMYLLHRLKKICCELLYRRHMRVETCARIFEKAVVAQEHGLKQLALEFIFRNYGGVLKAQVLQDMSPGVIEEFLDAVPDGAVLEVRGRGRAGVVGAWEETTGQIVGGGGGMKVLTSIGLGVGV